MNENPTTSQAVPPVYYTQEELSDNLKEAQLKEKDIDAPADVNEMVVTLTGGVIVVANLLFIRPVFTPEMSSGFVFHLAFLTLGLYLAVAGYVRQRQLLKSSTRINAYSLKTYDDTYLQNTVGIKKNDVRGMTLLFISSIALGVGQYGTALYAIIRWLVSEVYPWVG